MALAWWDAAQESPKPCLFSLAWALELGSAPSVALTHFGMEESVPLEIQLEAQEAQLALVPLEVGRGLEAQQEEQRQ